MAGKVCRVAGWWIVSLMAISCFAAPGSDLRLVEAVKNGDKSAVRSLLKQAVDVNARQADGATALAWAADHNDLETADLLIQARADVNAANEYGAAPLWLASAKVHAAMVEKLLNAGADPNAALKTGETALMAAANAGSVEEVKSLLDHGADVNAKETRGGQTALMWAVAENHSEVVRTLVEHGADVHARSKGGFTPLLFAAQQGNVESARILLAGGSDVKESTPKDGSVLLVASAEGHGAFSAYLVENGADPNAVDGKGYTPLHYAASRRNMLDAVKALLAHGANPNARLSKEPPNRGEGAIRMTGSTPLMLAAVVGNTEAVRALAASGADLNVVTKEKTTPLMIAAGVGEFEDRAAVTNSRNARLETAKLLVELGADVNAVGENGWTALHGAAYTGSDGIVEFLVAKGAKIDAMDRFGQTPLSISEGVITVGLGDDAVRRPRNVRRSTMDLLLKLGATPLEASGVQVVAKKIQ